MIEMPSKRPRLSDGFVHPASHHSPGKGTLHMGETPVRRRVSVDDSPEKYNGLSNAVRFESPTGAQTHLSSSSASPSSHADHSAGCSPEKDATPGGPGVHVLHGVGIAKVRRVGRATAEPADAPRTPESEDGSPRSAAPTAKKGSAPGDRHSRNTTTVLVEKDKKNQGLRQFSLRVCRQVEHKMTTTYNEVADELVKEFKDEETDVCDEKNIRRRAYDALNVLTAMDIIAKDKKDIRWKGWPPMMGDDGAPSAASHVHREKKRLRWKIEQKQRELQDKEHHLRELATQFVCLKQLLARNAQPEQAQTVAKHKILLPFVVVNTDKDNWIDLVISENKCSAEFTCTNPFKLHDDRETLNMMHGTLCPNGAIEEHLSPNIAKFLLSLKPGESRKRSNPYTSNAPLGVHGPSDDDCEVEHEEMAETDGEI